MSCTALTSSCNEQGRWCCSLGKNQIIKVTESVDWGNQENKHFKTFSQLVTYDVNKFFPDYDTCFYSVQEWAAEKKKKNAVWELKELCKLNEKIMSYCHSWYCHQ